MVKIGSNRLVIILKNYVIKIPIGIKGVIANYLEYVSYRHNPDIIAITTYHKLYNKQERLHNIKVFSLDTQYEDIPVEIQPLFKYRTFSRIQVGQSTDGNWKYFDYEDTKYQLFSVDEKEAMLKRMRKEK